MNIGYAPLLSTAGIRSWLERAIYNDEDRILEARLSFEVDWQQLLWGFSFTKDYGVVDGVGRWTIRCPKFENGSVALRNLTVKYASATDKKAPNDRIFEIIHIGYDSATTTFQLQSLLFLLFSWLIV